nr:uncharacterized protein LOC129417438 isoform X1 [Misgurnus anguillicaudatus]
MRTVAYVDVGGWSSCGLWNSAKLHRLNSRELIAPCTNTTNVTLEKTLLELTWNDSAILIVSKTCSTRSRQTSLFKKTLLELTWNGGILIFSKTCSTRSRQTSSFKKTLLELTWNDGILIFSKTCSTSLQQTSSFKDTSPIDRQTRGIKMGILAITEDDVASSELPTFQNFAIVLEEAIVLKDFPDLPSAVSYLFGLVFALNFEYPKELKYTFEVIEKVFMDMGTQCSTRVQSLKTKLLL